MGVNGALIVGTTFFYCSQQGLWIILSKGFMISGKTLLKVVISTADIFKTRQLTPKLSRLKNSSTDERKICIFDFWVNCPYCTRDKGLTGGLA